MAISRGGENAAPSNKNHVAEFFLHPIEISVFENFQNRSRNFVIISIDWKFVQKTRLEA